MEDFFNTIKDITRKTKDSVDKFLDNQKKKENDADKIKTIEFDFEGYLKDKEKAKLNKENEIKEQNEPVVFDKKIYSPSDKGKLLDPTDYDSVNADETLTVTKIDGESTDRRKVEYTEEELVEMARVVQREADIDQGRAGAVAVAEEIRNRVLTDIDPTYMPDTVHGVLFAKYQFTPDGEDTPLAGTEEAREDVIEMCRDVLEGKEWVFGRDNILGHASHEGTEIYSSQKGLDNTENMAAFYYDNLNRTQSFYAIGEPSEISVVSPTYATNKSDSPNM